MMYNHGNDVRSKRVYYLLSILKLLSLMSSGLAYDEHWNEIIKLTNISASDFKQNDVLNNEKVGLFVFTQYCGPGERIWKTLSGQGKYTYADIDVCCKQHDECPNYILSDSDYDRYSGLPRRNQIFARLECACDAKFFSCLNNLNGQYASTVAFGYGVFQSHCFSLNYPIVGCKKYSNGILALRRCTEYKVDATKDKIWQWFDVPPASSKLYDFPRTTTN